MPVSRRSLLALPAALALGALPCQTFAIDAPTGKVVLSVSTSGRPPVDFDMAMIEKLPQRSFTTATPWYPEPRTFTGPLLRDVLAAASAKGALLRAVALNDYKIEIPAADATKHDMIVARLLDGKPMPVREKGPLFIIYPFDSSAELRSERYYSRSAWQLRTLEVR
jgi:hypothetical protein